MKQPTFSATPAVLSFTSGVFISDALFFSEVDGQTAPVHVTRQGLRGTQNANTRTETEVTLIQTADSARLAPNADALVVRFAIRFLDLASTLHALANGSDKKKKPEKPKASDASGADDVKTLDVEGAEAPKKERRAKVSLEAYRASFDDFVSRSKTSEGLNEVSRRYARNLLNGRWLWRNRSISTAIEVVARVKGREIARADALSVPLLRFDGYAPGEIELANVIAESMRGDRIDGMIEIEARVEFGCPGNFEVYPSQCYVDVEAKPAGLGRLLYCVGNEPDLGQAAFRAQKVSNAIRTIDTWYPDYDLHGMPIAVEPLGANLNAQRFFRSPRSPHSAFELAKQFNTLDPNSADGMFMIAALMRGGVYSGGEG